ncbi:kinesin-like protein KIN-14K [Miscanthus floridulus]|uniref:kinesin-like protein KIN-14K n=1 Tax=Miscanthus floridulus TaxID=154761 RepID=UPI003458A6F3
MVIIEEEDTTKEFRRLETALTDVMKQIKEITRVAKQRRQLIKRMEPLAEENEKLKEARNLSEKNIQRAQRERDFVESNARDLEYQKGVLTEKLATVFEQVRSQSEQLAAVSSQLKSACKQLERKTEQLDSVSKQKAGYHHKVKAQFDVLVQEAKVQKESFDAIVTAIKSMLDCVDLELATQHDGRWQRSDTVVQRCKAAWENFKIFNRDTIMTIATHVLTVVRSHYPTIDLQSIGGGFTKGLSDAETQQLEDEVEDTAKTLAGDIDLFGETDGNGEAQ